MKILAISGKAGSGKDTFATLLKDALVAQGQSVLITHYADLLKYILKTFFDWDGQKDEAGRGFLQFVGTDVVRAQDENFWVDFLIRMFRFFPGAWDYVLIPDCRFPNEFERLKEAGFDAQLVRVWRPDSENVRLTQLTDDQKEHASETAMDDYPVDWGVANYGHLSSLLDTASWFAQELLTGAHQITMDEYITKYIN